jgi:peroxiredoxin
MAATTSSLQIGWKAAEFDLEGTDERHHRLAEACGPKGTLVMFICNHCPYVQAVLDDIIRDATELEAHGVRSIAIMPNDTRAYPADSFEKMKRLAQEKKLPFPYVIDRSQEVARAYDAVCSLDFFGFNADLQLQYHDRIYEVRNRQRVPGSRRELFDGLVEIARTGKAPAEQVPSMGCSIKWRIPREVVPEPSSWHLWRGA